MADSGTSKLPAPFGKYLLMQLIALGGMAEVYRAKIFGASGFEKDMVVKRILPKYASNPNFVQMLIDEAKIAVSLSHGNIVPIYELGELEGSYYIAMEYVEGRTILDVLRDAHSKGHPIPWAYCLGIAAEVARGLAYAHARADPQGKPLGLVHRDINPRNIVITPAGEVKILDFGIARASNKRHQTASGVIKGTPGYMSPEQMYGRAMDARSDIYCLGILVFELLTLRRLFPVWDVSEMRAVFEAGPVPRPSSIMTLLPPAVDEIVMRALAEDVGQRYQSAGQLEEALRTVIARSGTAVTASGLAREIAALDDAPGPRAPRTSPPIAESSAPLPPPQPSRPARATPRAEAQPALGASASPTATTMPKGIQPLTSTEPDGAGAPARVAPVRTQQMPVPAAPAQIDPPHSFVISLAAAPATAGQRLPIPMISAENLGRGSRTQVLAQNDKVQWAQQIGEDAEMLALLKATGAHPSAGRRAVLVAAALVGLVVAGLFAWRGEVIRQTFARALTGERVEPGVLVVKTVPSGADVVLDGKARGKTNLKITGLNVAEPHRLVVTPPGREPYVIELQRVDFEQGESGAPTYVFERTLSEPGDKR